MKRDRSIKKRRRLARSLERAAEPERPFIGRGPRYIVQPTSPWHAHPRCGRSRPRCATTRRVRRRALAAVGSSSATAGRRSSVATRRRPARGRSPPAHGRRREAVHARPRPRQAGGSIDSTRNLDQTAHAGSCDGGDRACGRITVTAGAAVPVFGTGHRPRFRQHDVRADGPDDAPLHNHRVAPSSTTAAFRERRSSRSQGSSTAVGRDHGNGNRDVHRLDRRHRLRDDHMARQAERKVRLRHVRTVRYSWDIDPDDRDWRPCRHEGHRDVHGHGVPGDVPLGRDGTRQEPGAPGSCQSCADGELSAGAGRSRQPREAVRRLRLRADRQRRVELDQLQVDEGERQPCGGVHLAAVAPGPDELGRRRLRVGERIARYSRPDSMYWSTTILSLRLHQTSIGTSPVGASWLT